MPNRFNAGCQCCGGCKRDVEFLLSNCRPPTSLTSEQQQLKLTGNPTAGTFTLSWQGQTTGKIALDAAPSDVQTALQSLPNVPPGGIACTGSSLPAGPITIDFTGLLGSASQPLITGNPTGLLPPGAKPPYAVVITEVLLGGQPLGNHPPSAQVTMTSDEYQEIALTGNPTGGTFTLSLDGQTTTQIAWNATPSTVQSALEALPNIGTGNVAVSTAISGEQFPGNPMFVAFQNALKAQQIDLLSGDTSTLTPNDKNQKYSIDVTEVLQGGQTLGPLDVDDTYGTVTFPQVQGGPWEYRATSPDYLDATGSVFVACPPKSPPQQVAVAMTVADGKIVADGVPAPFDPPASLSVNMGLPGGTGSIALVSCSAGTAKYAGMINNVPCWLTFVDNSTTPPTTYHTNLNFSLFLSLGCVNGLCVIWTLGNIPPAYGAFTRQFPPSCCTNCTDGQEHPSAPCSVRCDFCLGYCIWVNSFTTGINVAAAACGSSFNFVDPNALLGVWLWGGGCYTANANTVLSSGVSFDAPAAQFVGCAMDCQIVTMFGYNAIAACPAVTGSS